MNILMLCNKSPWPPKEGGPMAMNAIVEGLIREGHQVKILAVNSFKYNIREDTIPADYRAKTEIELIDVDLRIRPLQAFRHLFTGKSYHVVRFISDRFHQRLKEVLQSASFDIIQLETLFVAPYIDTIRRYSSSPVVLRSHNIEHLIWSRMAETAGNPFKKWYLRHLAATLKRYEKQVIQTVDAIVAITEKDADYFRYHAASIPVMSLPFGIDLLRFPKPENPGEPLSVYTIGAMNWIPNAEGVRWFLHHVWPHIHKTFPDAVYHLAGREMPSWMTSLQMPGVIIEGEVNDARTFSLLHGIMVVPLFSGSGIRIKIIEGMANGRAIVSTTVGAEGIDCTPGKDILIANAPCDFVEMLSWCLRDPEIRRKLGSGGRQLAEDAYDEPKLTGKLITFYHQLMG